MVYKSLGGMHHMVWGKPADADHETVGRSSIRSDISITGNLKASGELQLDGEVTGDVSCDNFTLGASGRIKGNVTAQSATIAGTVEGMVTATDLTIEKSARVLGDVAYESISIETGARVDGRLSQKMPIPGELKLVNSGVE